MLTDRRKHRPLDIALMATLGLNLITAVYYYGELNRSVQDISSRLSRVEALIDKGLTLTPKRR